MRATVAILMIVAVPVLAGTAQQARADVTADCEFLEI